MVLLGLAVGILTGGFPSPYAGDASTLAIILAMTFSLTEVRFRGLSVRQEASSAARAMALNYGVLTALILVVSTFYADEAIRNGWIVVAAAPSALAVIPITSVFRGNVRSALVSTAVLYLAAFAFFPAVTLTFAGRATDPGNLAFQILLLIGLPLAVSRALVRSSWVARHRAVLVNVSFFVLVLAITGANRRVFLEDPALIALLFAGAFVRSWVIGTIAFLTSWRLGRSRDLRISDTLFASLKNLGLSALFAFALFGPTAALPAIVCLFLEVSWILALARWLAR